MNTSHRSNVREKQSQWVHVHCARTRSTECIVSFLSLEKQTMSMSNGAFHFSGERSISWSLEYWKRKMSDLFSFVKTLLDQIDYREFFFTFFDEEEHWKRRTSKIDANANRRWSSKWEPIKIQRSESEASTTRRDTITTDLDEMMRTGS